MRILSIKCKCLYGSKEAIETGMRLWTPSTAETNRGKFRRSLKEAFARYILASSPWFIKCCTYILLHVRELRPTDFKCWIKIQKFKISGLEFTTLIESWEPHLAINCHVWYIRYGRWNSEDYAYDDVKLMFDLLIKCTN